MLDGPAVVEIAGRLGYTDTARWIRENPADYVRGVLSGFREGTR